MSDQKPDWTAEFKNAAGETLFVAGGEQSNLTKIPLTDFTFTNRALLQMEENELVMMRCSPLRAQWDHIVLNAEEFGIVDKKVERGDVSDVLVEWSQQQAIRNFFDLPGLPLD